MQEVEERELEIISNEIKDKICEMEIITPEIYASLFVEKAKEHGLNITSEYASEILEKKLDSYYKLQDQTTDGINRLSQTTSKAISAIKESNSSALSAVLEETKTLRKEIEKLKNTLYRDELTGVYNRKWMHDRLLDEKSETLNYSGVLALIDLNYFKIVNDTFGHTVGDKVLVFIATQLRKSGGKVVRYGGDEFIIFFKNEDELTIRKKISAIREDILKKHLKSKDSEFRVSFSFGTTRFEMGEHLESVLNRADEAMYEDKKKIKERIKGIEV